MGDGLQPGDGTPAESPRLAAVLVIDVVESMRLVSEARDHFVSLWSAFVRECRGRIVPAGAGEIVKHLGDGMLLLFGEVGQAVAASRAMQRWLAQRQSQQPAQGLVRLRMGVDYGEVLRNDIDVFGAAANLASRLAAAAAPDELLLSDTARAQVVPSPDDEVEDIGECYFKHLRQSVRCYRIGMPSEGLARRQVLGGQDLLLPRVAVLPPRRAGVGRANAPLADLVADSIIGQLSNSPTIRVISRLSTAPAARRRLSVTELAGLLGATYLLSGSLVAHGRQWRCQLELADGRVGEVIWSRGFALDPRELLLTDEPFGAVVAGHLFAAIRAHELRRSRLFPLPSLEAYALQLAALGLMHRASRDDFESARQSLEHLIERHPRAPSARAWMAKWWVLRTTRGFAVRPQDEAVQALTHIRTALQSDPDNALAWAMKGFVQCHMQGDLAGADASLDRAIDADRNEPLAHLFRSVVRSFRDEGESALDAAETALALSPLDPLRHYYDSLASSAAINARRYDRGIELAQRALRGNRGHLPTLRALTVAMVETDRLAEARRLAERVRALAPEFSIRRYVQAGPKGAESTRRRYAEAFALAGLPAG